jgi:predicted nucleic acid-binding protein
MISLDANIIFSVLNPHDVNYARARRLLSHRGTLEALVISPVVYSELCASPAIAGIRVFLKKTRVAVLWEMPETVWQQAGHALGQYAVQRRGGQLPRRIVADFLIGAHAQHHKLHLMTFDDTVYAAAFPGLRVIG